MKIKKLFYLTCIVSMTISLVACGDSDLVTAKDGQSSCGMYLNASSGLKNNVTNQFTESKQYNNDNNTTLKMLGNALAMGGILQNAVNEMNSMTENKKLDSSIPAFYKTFVKKDLAKEFTNELEELCSEYTDIALSGALIHLIKSYQNRKKEDVNFATCKMFNDNPKEVFNILNSPQRLNTDIINHISINKIYSNITDKCKDDNITYAAQIFTSVESESLNQYYEYTNAKRKKREAIEQAEYEAKNFSTQTERELEEEINAIKNIITDEFKHMYQPEKIREEFKLLADVYPNEMLEAEKAKLENKKPSITTTKEKMQSILGAQKELRKKINEINKKHPSLHNEEAELLGQVVSGWIDKATFAEKRQELQNKKDDAKKEMLNQYKILFNLNDQSEINNQDIQKSDFITKKEQQSSTSQKIADHSQLWHKVIAQPKLVVRKTPNINGEKMSSIPYGEKIKIIEKTQEIDFINNKSGFWVKITWQDITGYAFDAFLEPIEAETSTNELSEKDSGDSVIVPDLTSNCIMDVDSVLKPLGLLSKEISIHGPIDEDAAGIGCPYRQSPKPGTTVKKGATVTYRAWWEAG